MTNVGAGNSWGSIVQMEKYVVDINSDIGEGFGSYEFGLDSEIIKHVTSINLACGWHAGDPAIMDKTVKLAKVHGIAVGAHPGYPDLLGFGRRAMTITRDDAKNYLLYQVGAAAAIAAANGVALSHVKLHGAFYNQACVDEKLADGVLDALQALNDSLNFFNNREACFAQESFGDIRACVSGAQGDVKGGVKGNGDCDIQNIGKSRCDIQNICKSNGNGDAQYAGKISEKGDARSGLMLMALSGSYIIREARRRGISVCEEVFADRGYNADGTLVDRRSPGAFIHDADEAAERVVRMVREGSVKTVDGGVLPIRADSVCVHGDNPQAVEFAAKIRRGLQAAGIKVAAPVNWRK